MSLEERATSAFWREFISQEIQLEIRCICFPCSLWELGCFYAGREINTRIWVLQIRHVLGIKPSDCAPGQEVLGQGVLCEGRLPVGLVCRGWQDALSQHSNFGAAVPL